MKPTILKLLESTNIEDIQIGLSILHKEDKEKFIKYCCNEPHFNSDKFFFILEDATCWLNHKNNLVYTFISETTRNFLKETGTEVIII